MQKQYESQGKELNAARLRMATLPEGAEVSRADVHVVRGSLSARLAVQRLQLVPLPISASYSTCIVFH